MFNKADQLNAYNMATQTIPKTRQVVMLYDGAIRFMQQARKAIEDKRFEDRLNLLQKAADILIGLQGSLDFKNGGEIAPLLYDYYSSLDSRILYIHRTNDLRILDSAIAELKQMREAWGVVDTGEVKVEPAAATTAKPLASQPQNKAPSPAAAEAAVAAAAIDRSVFVSA